MRLKINTPAVVYSLERGRQFGQVSKGKLEPFNHLGFNSPPLAASCHSGKSRNPEIYTGCRIRSGMTSDTPLLCGGVVH
jgi:hypothetical protein